MYNLCCCRYDWAIDRLQHYVNKARKKGRSPDKPAQALTEKCQAIEERRYELPQISARLLDTLRGRRAWDERARQVQGGDGGIL